MYWWIFLNFVIGNKTKIFQKKTELFDKNVNKIATTKFKVVSPWIFEGVYIIFKCMYFTNFKGYWYENQAPARFDDVFSCLTVYYVSILVEREINIFPRNFQTYTELNPTDKMPKYLCQFLSGISSGFLSKKIWNPLVSWQVMNNENQMSFFGMANHVNLLCAVN